MQKADDMNLHHLEKLFEHMWWADAEVLHGMDSQPNVPQEALELYGHIVGAELVWLARIRKVEQPVPVWPKVNLQGCAKLAARSQESYKTFLSNVKSADLTRLVPYTNSAGTSFETPLEDILLHVVLHGADHRGQIARMFRETGGIPTPTDYISYVRGAPAATHADSG